MDKYNERPTVDWNFVIGIVWAVIFSIPIWWGIYLIIFKMQDVIARLPNFKI